MTYRKLKLGDKIYEYTIGKSHTKIKGIGVYLNEVVGIPFDHQKWRVTPAVIISLITKKPLPTPKCDCGSIKVTYCADPFLAEIFEKYEYAYYCESCYEKRAEYI